ncbi:MAG TPA: transposase [Candidatus Saccharimonadales bacterium]|jgi:transposase|nr:transposase [Candidatus Saccharimonadales bacterium]
MDVREQRGKEIAASGVVRKTAKDLIWQVPAQGRNGYYRVDLAGENPVCECPDFELRSKPCKHIFAVAYTVVSEQNPDGSTTVTETVVVTAAKRKTYPQNWKAYNVAQTNEGDKFQALLRDLCSGVPTPQAKNGRPPLPLSDAIFSATFEVYSTISQRRFMSDLRESHERGLISRVPHFNCISNTLENENLTPILRSLITQSSLPLKSVEVDFAVDSSGFTTSKFIRWFDVKYGKPRAEHEWVKMHLMCGVKTNIVTAVEVGEQFSGDAPFFPPMIATTAQNFQIAEASGDKGYDSVKCVESVVKAKGKPYIALRDTATGGVGGAYREMFHYFQFKRDEFLTHYHKRSNVESTFSMIKRKFGDYLRSKNKTAMINEALRKILCHNIVVLIHEMHELGIDPVFWQTADQ